MFRVVFGLISASFLAGCASAPAPHIAGGDGPSRAAKPVSTENTSSNALTAARTDTAPAADGPRQTGPWIGAAPASELILRGKNDTLLGVWIDVPEGPATARAKTAVALVVDTSGSMAGPKIEHARAAARRMMDSLNDGDIVAVEAFSDRSVAHVAPTLLDATSRRWIGAAIDDLGASGGTNLFDGLRMGELRAASSPASHAVRRVVVISDGVATVGPTSTELLGEMAERGADHGIQVTAIGVGLDYDERALNALAVRSSGRMHHIASPDDMTRVLAEETRLFAGTRATDAFVEIVPAPGVTLMSVPGVRAVPVSGGALRVPLGAMFGGQHREMLVRARVSDTATPGAHPLASVRLHFRDPSDGGIERVQEVVARYEMTDDATAVASRENARTRSIAAVQEAAQIAIAAAQDVNRGDFKAADAALAQAEERLASAASSVRDESEKKRVMAAAQTMTKARRSAAAASAAPAPARRAISLDINSDAMHEAGF
ncbi:vWA domain-containing protein [Polyangium aurulentum]|uniref:vWA domain-containing protein n=1 Tax=Polyangium aurulentum TaxID=2567896 RepID=UPI001F3F1740|nr:VWA domain-containing protein [Polyangium aurulentum]